MSFYIEEIKVSGSGKADSIIKLKQGVNIIYGPSNTGKSYIINCIDYMFGAKDSLIDESFGYDTISLTVRTESGSVVMRRGLGKKKVVVDSDDPSVESGEYNIQASAKNHDKTINYVWLSLFGIKECHSVILNDNFDKRVLSCRTFLHMFLLTETKIIAKESVVLSNNLTTNTAEISSLIFLLTGQDFEDSEKQDSDEIKKAKRTAVKAYINKELFSLSERSRELTERLGENESFDLEEEIKEALKNIASLEKQIQESVRENQAILERLHICNEELSECKVLLSRYDELMTQYNADVRRLSFIVDGEANIEEHSEGKCPFCDGKISLDKTNYIEAAIADCRKIKLQMKDLEKAQKALQEEKEELEREIAQLLAKKQTTEELISIELTPTLEALNEKLALFREIVELKREIEILKKIAEQKSSDIIAADEDDGNAVKFKVKEHLDYGFIETISKDIKTLLEKSHYDNLLTAVFDKNTMDVVVNGKAKRSNGKGYCAFLNTTVALALARYMIESAKYAPSLLVLDSPILSFKETDDKKPSDSMRNGLFENLVSQDNDLQLIIVENEIPSIDYKGSNLIHFTKNREEGRYGFLNGVE